MIDTSGPILIEETCFTDNEIGVAPVVVYANTWAAKDNFGSFNKINGADPVCPFIADFQNQAQFEFFRPSCFNFDVFDTCRADGTARPTSSPSATPTVTASSAPTVTQPSSSPSTSAPSMAGATPAPTPPPTNAPPTAPPTAVPPTDQPAAPTAPTASGSSAICVSYALFASITSFLWIV